MDAILNRSYPPIARTSRDQYRVEVFVKEFDQYVRNRNLPHLVIMCLTTDHTEGTQPHYSTPRAMVADNDLALTPTVLTKLGLG